jgi:DNA-binding response OmpR family regulator
VQISKNLGIVIGEPDKDIQELYNIYLKKLGIREDRIMVAKNGKKCVEIFENQNKNKKQRENDNDDVLVILDTHLKDTSNLNVAKEIMNINPQQKMIPTRTSSLKDVKNFVKDVSASIEEDMILIKPFRLSQLLSVIKTITAYC